MSGKQSAPTSARVWESSIMQHTHTQTHTNTLSHPLFMRDKTPVEHLLTLLLFLVLLSSLLRYLSHRTCPVNRGDSEMLMLGWS